MLVGVVLGGCATVPTRPRAATPIAATVTAVQPPGTLSFGHIFVILLENKEAPDVVDSPSAPFLNSLARQYARAARFYGTSHPSLPNYLALTGGDTFGITTNCTTCFLDRPNLADGIERSGRTWKAYMESMPSPCFEHNDGNYAQKHDPFMYYKNIRDNPDRCAKVVPLEVLKTDLESGQVPDFVWITPDMCNSTHDCELTKGDEWLKEWVPRIMGSSAWGPDAVLFITFDEGDSDAGCCRYAAGGVIDTVVVSPLARPGFVSERSYDHYSLLRTIEEAWGLPLLGKSACECSPAMDDMFALSDIQ